MGDGTMEAFGATEIQDLVLTLFYAGGGGHICPSYHIAAIFSRRTYRRRLQVYSKFKFCNCRTYEFGPGSKIFSLKIRFKISVGGLVLKIN